MPAETPTGTHQASLCRVPVGREVRSVAMGAMTNAWLARLSRHRPHGRKRSSATQAGQSHSVGCAEHLAIAKRYGNCLMCDSPLMLREETHDRRWGWAGLHIPPNAKGGQFQRRFRAVGGLPSERRLSADFEPRKTLIWWRLRNRRSANPARKPTTIFMRKWPRDPLSSPERGISHGEMTIFSDLNDKSHSSIRANFVDY